VYHVLDRADGRLRIVRRESDFEALEKILADGPTDSYSRCTSVEKEIQMQTRRRMVVVCVLAAALAGCGRREGQDQSSPPSRPAPAAQAPAPAANATPTPGEPSSDLAKPAEQNHQALTQMNDGKVIKVVPAATLKDLLPADLPGMQRTDASARQNQTIGVEISIADGQYAATDGGNARVRIMITDIGSLGGSLRMGMASWTAAQSSHETDTGYEKVTVYEGHKAFEEYNTQNLRGALRVLVADRFLVEVEGNGVTMDALKQMLGKVDLRKLAAAGS